MLRAEDGNSNPTLQDHVDAPKNPGRQVETGDSLEVAYTGWLLQNHVLGQVKPCVLQVLSLCVTRSLPYGA